MNLEKFENIESIIYTIRGMQVMLDSDLAKLYQTETKYINRAVNRNVNRFPDDFAFQLTDKEWESLRFQIGTLEEKANRGKHRKYLPWVFTEHGVTMISSVLNSEIAIQASVYIIKTFVSMRKFLMNNAAVFQRLEQVELNQLKSNERIDHLFNALDKSNSVPSQGVFFDGHVFDAYELMSRIIRSAKTEIILIDNYEDESVLVHLSKRTENVKAIIYTKSISRSLQLDLERHNSQYPPIHVRELRDSHDRFLIIDQKELYHISASLKDLGKKWFAFSKLNKKMLAFVLERLLKIKAKKNRDDYSPRF